MIEKRSEQPEILGGIDPLRQLTPAQFAALGGSAVAFVRPILGSDLSQMIDAGQFDDEEVYQLVMSADGTPLMVGDTAESVADWLGDKQLGLVSVH